MLALFRNKPLLDEGTRLWFWDTYTWALNNFGADIFFNKTVLVTPSDQHFPDKSNDGAELIQKVFARVKHFAAMQQWPTKLIASEDKHAVSLPLLEEGSEKRGNNILFADTETYLQIHYNPGLLHKPDLLIATLAQTLAGALAHTAAELPPGGKENLGPATDLLAIFMGFGIFLSNNAFNYHVASCGGCRPAVQMLGDLTEEQMAYALAMFCALKDIDKQAALGYLKSTLRPFFKKACKEVGSQMDNISQLRSLR